METHEITARVTQKRASLPQVDTNVVGDYKENVTKSLLNMWKVHKKHYRIKTKKETAEQINRRMRMRFLPKIQEAMTPYETIGIHKFHIDFDRTKLKPKRRKKHEYTPLPSVAGE